MSSSRPSSKFLSRASVGDVVSSAYDLLTTAGQMINPIKSTSSTQTNGDEAAVKEFQNAVSTTLCSVFGFCSITIIAHVLVQEEPRVVP